MTEEDFDTFYVSTFARLVGQVYAMWGNVAGAQDCVRKALVRAWDKRRALDSDQAPEAWGPDRGVPAYGEPLAPGPPGIPTSGPDPAAIGPP